MRPDHCRKASVSESAATVFLVRDGAIQTVAVFSTRKKAQAWIDRQPDCVGNLGPYRPSFDIEEVQVDAEA